MPGLVSLTLKGKMQLPALQIPTYGMPVGICRLILHVVQALQSCPGLLCRVLLEVFGCIFVVA